MKRYYKACPECRIWMIRTGKKEKLEYIANLPRLYRIEYRCPHCLRFWTYNEYTKLIEAGQLDV